MKVFFDTSVLVAGMVEAHPEHARALPCLREAIRGDTQMVVATHTLAETYAVLSSLPVRPRLGPAVARDLIRHNIEAVARIAELSAGEYAEVLDSLAELGLSGGVTYDALAAHAARKENVSKLLTFNPKHYLRVWPDGEALITVP